MTRNRSAILVLGMHRSGTSALTRVLNLLGPDLPGDLIPPLSNDNETGFWESESIVAVHDRCLSHLGLAWDDVLGVPPAFFTSDAAREAVEDLVSILDRELGGSRSFVIKDPRLCRLLPLWNEVLERCSARPHAVLIGRHPDEVAASLARRDRLPADTAGNLWLRHVVDMERHSRGWPRSLVTYDALLRDWRSTVTRIAADLAIDWDRRLDDAAVEIDGFLQVDLRHHHAADRKASITAEELSDRVGRTWSAYLASVEADRSQDDALDHLAEELDRAEALLAPTLIATARTARELRSEIESLHLEHGSAAEAYELEIARARHGLDALQRKSDEQAVRLARIDDERNSLIADAKRAEQAYEKEIMKIRQVMEEADAKVYEKQRVLEEVMAERDQLGDRLHQQEQAARALAEQLDRARVRTQELDQQLGQANEEAEARLQSRVELLDKRHDAEIERLGEYHAAEIERQDQRHRAELLRQRDKLQSTEEELARIETALADLRRETDELRSTLRDTQRDKDWLWERWHEAKDELALPRQSKIGRLVFWQWSTYLAVRRRLVRLKDSVLTGARRQRPDDSKTAAPPRRRIATSLARIPMRAARRASQAAGWLYLLLKVRWESLRAVIRRRKPVSLQLATADEIRPIPRPPRVLLVSPYPIYPANHGGGVRLYNLIRHLQNRCDLHLLIFSTTGEDPKQRQALEPWVSSVHFHDWQPRFEPGWWHLEPPNVGLFASAEAARTIAHLLASRSIDILQLEYTELGQYGMPEFTRVKVVLTEHDLAFRQHSRRRRMGFHRRFPEGNAYGSSYGDLLRLTRYELAVCRRADQIHVMSEHDGQQLAAYLADGGDRIRVVPNAVATDFYAPKGATDQRRHVLYVGNFQNLPNVDALEHLATDIWPRVDKPSAEVRLRVVGAHPSERVTRFDGEQGIEVIGPVPDLRQYYHSHRLMVAPIRAGSGTRLKILEAFAAGIPVVSTTIGAEGIAATHERHLLVADEPQAFAAAIDRLLSDDELCEELASNALQLARDRYDWERSAEATLAGWSELLEGSGDQPAPSLSDASAPITRSAADRATSNEAGRSRVDISIIIPTFRGGDMLRRCLTAISSQRTARSFEIVCVDSGSPASDLETMRAFDARVVSIDSSEFDHGLTRDLGAAESRGEVLVFLNQDAIPENELWLERLTTPLLEDDSLAAVQGGIVEVADVEQRFFWDSCGERFYFTRESDRWMERYFGIGFSTVNAAIRRRVWEETPFGHAPIMEDKLWQKRIVDRGQVIRPQSDATVTHTHNYSLRALWRRCLSEGFGWRLLGERYSLLDMTRDGMQLRVHRELLHGLAGGRVRSAAEALFPWLRPLALYWGNRWSRGVRL